MRESVQFMFAIPVQVWKLEGDKGLKKKNCKILLTLLFHVPLQSYSCGNFNKSLKAFYTLLKL